jgi:hypothetical protein
MRKRRPVTRTASFRYMRFEEYEARKKSNRLNKILVINYIVDYWAKKYGSVIGAVCLYKFHVMKN